MEDRRSTLQEVLGRTKHEGKNGWVVVQLDDVGQMQLLTNRRTEMRRD
jgi:hypothetical protein